MPKITYTVASLTELADEFENRSKDYGARAQACRTQRDKDYCSTQAQVWNAAAEIVRNTTIIPEPPMTEAHLVG